MAVPIIGENNNQQQPMGVKINPNDIKPVMCKQCGSPFYQTVYAMGELSGLLVGQTNNQYIPVAEYLVCIRCGLELGKEVPVYTEPKKENKDKTDNNVVVGEEEIIEDSYTNIVEFGKANSSTEG